MILDTNVLVKLERETRRGMRGPASRFVDSLPETRFCVTPTISGEFASGTSMSEQAKWKKALAPYKLVRITAETAWIFGENHRYLSARGTLIGSSDLWIAATALTHGLPIATGNTREFSRVPDLEVIAVG
jgi:tRNA(fMet)-specific endonuclease VapC